MRLAPLLANRFADQRACFDSGMSHFPSGCCINRMGTLFPKTTTIGGKNENESFSSTLDRDTDSQHGQPGGSEHREITKWISSPTGSLIGSGYTSTYLTNIRAKTTERDDAKLRGAINMLDGLGMVEVRGFGLLPAAVAWQAETPFANWSRSRRKPASAMANS